MKPIRTLLLLAACLPAASCYQDIDMERYRPEPTLVLNCILSPGVAATATVSQTVFFTDHREGTPAVTDTEVRLIVNGRPAATMTYDEESGRYVSDFRPQAGDTVTVEASTARGRARGQAVLPAAVPITKVSLSGRNFEDKDIMIAVPGGVVYGRSYEVTYRITFTDPAGRRDYYCIRVETDDGYSASNIDYSHDEVFTDQQPLIEGADTDTKIYGDEGRTFTDDLFDGQTYTMRLVEKNELPSGKKASRPRKVILYALSEAYYRYLTGILNEDEESVTGNLTDWGLAEPSPHYSNVSGGTGIVGAVQSVTYRVDLQNVIY